MTNENIAATKDLIRFIEASPTAFHAVENAKNALRSAGFEERKESEPWTLVPGGKYFVTRNQSSLIAFTLPETEKTDGAALSPSFDGHACPTPLSFLIMASHTDAPCYKLKTETETDAFGKYIKLNVENYGGMIASSWLDRPLSVAGRVIVEENGAFTSKTVNIDRDLLLIPNVAVHQNRNVNSGFTYNAAVDMMPLFSSAEGKGSLKKQIAAAAGVPEEAIVSSDLYLYNRTPASIWGADNEFYSCPAIDNRQCAYGTLQGFLRAAAKAQTTDSAATADTSDADGAKVNVPAGDFAHFPLSVPVYASFDNEETGSATKQGAGSPFLFDTLSRIAEFLGADLRQALASSFMVSADNGHAKHPNHPEWSDAKNVPHLNGGVVIKSNAAQKYATDAISAALFTAICKKAGVPVQLFANRSDMAGGSTLGSISNTKVALNTVDIGLAQLAMHSSYETGGTADTAYLIQAATAFYQSKIFCGGDGVYRLG